MGGVNPSDSTFVHGKKWYFPLVSRCVDMQVHNAWQLYKHEGESLDQLGFKRSIATVLLTQNKKICLPKRVTIRKPKFTLRYDRLDHMIISQEKQTRCDNCHQKTTRCKKCKKNSHGVHVKCFKKYHTQFIVYKIYDADTLLPDVLYIVRQKKIVPNKKFQKFLLRYQLFTKLGQQYYSYLLGHRWALFTQRSKSRSSAY